jgi:SAM-dependent methyltransferase
MNLVGKFKCWAGSESGQVICQVVETTDQLTCLTCQKCIRRSLQWFDFLTDTNKNAKTDVPEYLVGKASSMHWLRKQIWYWHQSLESKFLRQLTVVPDGHSETVMATLKEYFQQNVPDPQNAVLLDIGGGIGRWHFLSDSLNCHHVVVDLANPEYLELPGSIHYCQASADALPLRDEIAAAIVSFEMLEHCRYPDRVISEMNRVLEQNGVVILTTRQYWKTHGSPNDYYRYTRYGLEEMFRMNGFKLLKIIPMGGPASIIATVIDQNVSLLSKPILKEVFLYPFWWLMMQIDRIFYLNKDTFMDNPDTTGWLVVATKQ